MNRIYQGRISRIEVANDAGDWQKSPDWKSMLSDHHALFQDAINYYIVALLGMAISDENRLTKIRERLAETCENGEPSPNQIWTKFRRSGDTRPGLRDSLARTVHVEGADSAPEEYFKAILCGNTADEEVLDMAVRELLAKTKSGEGAIQKQGRGMLPMFCDPCANVTFPYSAASLAKLRGTQRLGSELHDLDPSQLKDFAEETDLGWVVILQEGKPRRGAKARDCLREAAAHFTQALDDGQAVLAGWPTANDDLNAITASIDQMSDEQAPDIPCNKGGNISWDRVYALLLFKHFPTPFTWELLKNFFPKKDPENRPQNDHESEKLRADIEILGDDPIKLARGDQQYVFPAFTALLLFGGNGKGEPAWKEFDIAAFKEALKSLHQIEAKGKERDKERKGLEEDLACMNNERAWKSRSEGDKEAPDVLVGDPRIERLEEILTKERVQSYEMADGEEREYGLNRRTIRGFGRLRERWRRTVKQGVGYTDALRKKLLKQLKEYQRENADSIGSVPLFEELTKANNWIVWQEPSMETIKTWHQKAKIKAGLDFSDNPLEALAEKRRVEREIDRLKEPVRLTPADPEHSPRHYSFSDDGSFKLPKWGHQPDQQSIVVSIAAEENGVFKKRQARLYYGAPRLARDGLHKSGGQKLANSPFLQPMMEGLGCTEALEQTGNHAVSLMPKKDNRGDDQRFLLNFAPNIDTGSLIAKLGKQARWAGQFASFGSKNLNLYLRWPSVVEVAKSQRPADGWWWQGDNSSFTCLAVDLGQRTAGAFAVVEARANAAANGKPARFIGKTGDGRSLKEWRAFVTAQGMLRLPGEDRRILVNGEWVQEQSGKKGRMNCEDEWQAARDICDELGIAPAKVGLGDDVRLSFSEVNDRLLRAFGWAKWRLQRLQSLSWRLCDDTHREEAVQEITDKEELRDLLDLTGEEAPEHIAEVVIPKLEALRSKLPRMLERITDRVLPIRDGHWKWTQHPQSPGSHTLCQVRNTRIARKKIMGQRGLSFNRIEQLAYLRRHAQGLNKALIHTPGKKPQVGHSTYGEEWPDPCPEILDKLNRTKDQRINQTAHMILAEALGVRLRAPKKLPDLRVMNDIHGEYQRFRDPVDFIVLEDLSRYLSSQDRAPRENSRLMQWSHRAVLNKLKELAELYGIPVIEANAAYSSRFCSRSGAVGFRAVSLTPDRRNDWYWERKLSRQQRGEKREIELNGNEKKELEYVRDLFDTLDKINTGRSEARKPLRTLLAPLGGGPIFVPADGSTSVTQADINAAINLALRSIASPDCLDIHLRIRTQVKDGTIRLRLESNQEKARWGQRSDKAREVCLDSEHLDVLAKQRYPNFFVDRGKVANYDKACIDGVDDQVASSRGLFGSVKDCQWKIVKRLNDAKLEKWGCKRGPDEDLPF